MAQKYYGKKEIIDMDTKQRLSCSTDSSSTSGYSTTSSISNYSPVQSPDIQSEFLTLNVLPHLTENIEENLQIAYVNNDSFYNNSSSTCDYNDVPMEQMSNHISNNYNKEYTAELKISEEPTEKFRFRYKSEMHGTHGSLNGANSQRNPKTFPEVQLCNYDKPAIIRCSLFQVNMHSPHSHQLVIRKDDIDIVDPHDVRVSPEEGYFAKFSNMGIIQTAKKFIVKELFEKKRRRLIFELGRKLTTKEEQQIIKQTEKEAKDMNLNQVRLCFEAFQFENDSIGVVPVPITAPVYSRIINNRKSAQTGELRITRLSICTGSVSGGEDMILLVEKVSKKNIKIRFYEMFDDDVVWEAFAYFRESDVHHQYAIVCKTPPYKDRDIDHTVEVFIELLRPSDDERSYPPVAFRYKPREAIASRKRRRVSSTTTNNSSGSTLNSGDLPKTVQECRQMNSAEIMEELDRLLRDSNTKQKLSSFSDESTLDEFLKVLDNNTFAAEDILQEHRTERDGISTHQSNKKHFKKKLLEKEASELFPSNASSTAMVSLGSYLQRILNIFLDVRSGNLSSNQTVTKSAAEQINIIFHEHLDSTDTGDSIMHEIIANDNMKMAKYMCQLLNYFQLNDLLNCLLNNNKQTVLHYACLYNRPQYIRPILSLGCKSNIQDKRGNTAIHLTIIERHSRCLECLINFDKMIQLNILNDDGFTPLHLAIRDNNDDMAKKMLHYDKTIAAVANSKDGNNALHMAIQQQHLQLIKLILQTQNVGPILQATNAAGYVPLALAKQMCSNNELSLTIYNTLEKYYREKQTLKWPSPSLNAPRCGIENYRADLLIKEEQDEEDGSILSSLSLAEDCGNGSGDGDHSDSDIDDDSSNQDNNKINTNKKFKKTSTDIKLEFIIDKNNWEKALSDPVIFEALCKCLNKNELWKQIAIKLDIEHFYMNNAAALLNMMQRNIDDIDYKLLSEAFNNTEVIEIVKKV